MPVKIPRPPVAYAALAMGWLFALGALAFAKQNFGVIPPVIAGCVSSLFFWAAKHVTEVEEKRIRAGGQPR
mgnify:CR=1 FL=1